MENDSRKSMQTEPKRGRRRDDISKWQPRPPETSSISFYLETYPETTIYNTRH